MEPSATCFLVRSLIRLVSKISSSFHQASLKCQSNERRNKKEPGTRKLLLVEKTFDWFAWLGTSKIIIIQLVWFGSITRVSCLFFFYFWWWWSRNAKQKHNFQSCYYLGARNKWGEKFPGDEFQHVKKMIAASFSSFSFFCWRTLSELVRTYRVPFVRKKLFLFWSTDRGRHGYLSRERTLTLPHAQVILIAAVWDWESEQLDRWMALRRWHYFQSHKDEFLSS